MRRRVVTILILIGIAVLGFVLVRLWQARFFDDTPRATRAVGSGTWRAMVDRFGWIGSPGPLSAGHKTLSNDCPACHVPFRTVSAIKCLECHANATGLMARRDTAFHAQATRCATCHTEHQGRGARISRMEHAVLAPDIGCAQCHIDRHDARFGDACADCHGVETWKLSRFRHPAPGTPGCVQCHAEPPSHRMMHFQMVDQRVTGEHGAAVEQCWKCHMTDHWNNIIGVGLYKHH